MIGIGSGIFHPMPASACLDQRCGRRLSQDYVPGGCSRLQTAEPPQKLNVFRGSANKRRSPFFDQLTSGDLLPNAAESGFLGSRFSVRILCVLMLLYIPVQWVIGRHRRRIEYLQPPGRRTSVPWYDLGPAPTDGFPMYATRCSPYSLYPRRCDGCLCCQSSRGHSRL